MHKVAGRGPRPIEGMTRQTQRKDAVLVLTRKPHETIVIDQQIEIEVLEVRKGAIRLGITAPKSVPIRRGELECLARTDSNVPIAIEYVT